MTVPLKDPVCGMTVRPDSAFSASHNGQPFFFRSEQVLGASPGLSPEIARH
jgi:YHS domain-containing protein